MRWLLNKRSLTAPSENNIDQQLELEQNLQYLALSSQDYKERCQAFVENACNLPDAKESIYENSDPYCRRTGIHIQLFRGGMMWVNYSGNGQSLYLMLAAKRH
jgi:hypothetical protein